MGAAGVLGAAYAMLATEADAKDQTAGMWGDAQNANHREDLDAQLNEPLDDEVLPPDQQGEADLTNVTDLALWVAKANQIFGD